MMVGWVVGTVGVARGAADDDGVDDAGVRVAAELGALVAVSGGLVAGAVEGVVTVPSPPSAGASTCTLVDGVDVVLALATPASRPTPATPPAATISVMFPTRDRPSSRAAGVRGRIVMPAILAGRCKALTAGR
jgi:hypothetical protein